MASLFKNLSKSVSVSAEALTTTVQASANIISSVAKTTQASVEGASSPILNTLKVADNYSKELVLDSDLSLAKAEMINKAKASALDKVLEDEEVIAKIEKAESDRLLAEIMEDYDLPS